MATVAARIASAKAAPKQGKGTFFNAIGKMSDAIVSLIALGKRRKKIADDSKVVKDSLTEWGLREWTERYVEMKDMPARPMKLVAENGQAITFQIQDRSGQYSVSDAQIAELAGILEISEEVVRSDMTYDEPRLTFDRVLMANPKVAKAVMKALDGVVADLKDRKVLPPELADELVVVEVKRAFVPRSLDSLLGTCRGDAPTMVRVIEAMGSSVPVFVEDTGSEVK